MPTQTFESILMESCQNCVIGIDGLHKRLYRVDSGVLLLYGPERFKLHEPFVAPRAFP